MAEKYIVNMPLKTTPDDTDLMIIEDAQDTKRMTWANVVKPIEDLVDNTVAAHLAESASKHITESGSNENGHYIKFDDGTQICRGNIVLDDNATGGKYFAFPSSFINLDYSLKISVIGVASGGAGSAYAAEQLRVAGGVQFRGKALLFAGANITAPSSVQGTFTAIGRWK